MKSKTQLVFKRKELQDLLDNVKQYAFSDIEQQRIQSDINLLGWVLDEGIKQNTLIKNQIDG